MYKLVKKVSLVKIAKSVKYTNINKNYVTVIP
jgi:hypothetical protein